MFCLYSSVVIKCAMFCLYSSVVIGCAMFCLYSSSSNRMCHVLPIQ